MDRDGRRGRCFGDNEERKLELRLGPPGEDWLEIKEESEKDHFFNSAFPLNPFSRASKPMAAHFSAGTKRGYRDSIEPKTEAFKQQEETDFLHLQAMQEIEKEISQRNGRPDQQLSLEVIKCCLPLPKSTTASGSVAVAHNRPQIRSASTPVVGWPPIRSSRKNLSSSSKQTVESEPGSSGTASRKPKTGSKSFFVKINMEGIPIGRKIDLLAYDCYEELSLAVDELFRDLLAAQMDPIAATKESVEKHAITGLLDGSGEYILIYEDDEGDRMLVGDVPWEMFVSTAKRLRVLKSSEVSSSSSSMGTFSRKKKPT